MTSVLKLPIYILRSPFLSNRPRTCTPREFRKDNRKKIKVGERSYLAGSTVFRSVNQCLHVLATIIVEREGSTDFSLMISTKWLVEFRGRRGMGRDTDDA
jgi:hypothetical protein